MISGALFNTKTIFSLKDMAAIKRKTRGWGGLLRPKMGRGDGVCRVNFHPNCSIRGVNFYSNWSIKFSQKWSKRLLLDVKISQISSKREWLQMKK